MSLEENSLIEYAMKHVEDPSIRNLFLELMVGAMLGKDIALAAREQDISDDSPVWQHIADYFKQSGGKF